VALLEGLLEAEAMAVVTTHMTRLAAAALESVGAACAAMEFDPESGEPTFRLRPGAPGGSQALNLAARLGLPRAWLERADSLLDGRHGDLRRLLHEVEEVRRDLAATQAELTRELRALESERQLVSAERTALTEERDRLGAGLRKELGDFRRRVTEQLRDELERMKQEIGSGRRKGLVAAAVRELFEDEPEFAEPPSPEAGPVEVGATVRHRSLGWSGRLEEIRGEVAELLVRGKRVQCALADLVAVRENERVEPRRLPAVELARSENGPEKTGAELNLLGQRVEPALESLDRFLDRALLSSPAEVRVIHGFGSGRLRAAVRQHLRSHPAVAGQRPGRRNEGGDGATVVTLARG
jgi:DNA mismatch repair protein MutS2